MIRAMPVSGSGFTWSARSRSMAPAAVKPAAPAAPVPRTRSAGITAMVARFCSLAAEGRQVPARW
jgi:hypothetical protein